MNSVMLLRCKRFCLSFFKGKNHAAGAREQDLIQKEEGNGAAAATGVSISRETFLCIVENDLRRSGERIPKILQLLD